MQNLNLSWKFLPAVFALSILAYTAYRAATLSLTHDEALSFLTLQSSSWSVILHSANTHYVNSVLIWFTSHLFGPSEPVLRLPNVMAHALYIVFSWRILQSFVSSRMIQAAGLVLLNLNPFVLDFFSLARGYGLGLGCMMVSLFYLLRYTKAMPDENNTGLVWPVCIFAGLAVLANFVFVVFYLSVLFIVVLWGMTRTVKDAGFSALSDRAIGIQGIVIFNLVFLSLMAVLLLYIKSQGFFYFGGDSGFWTDTVGSLVSSSLYQQAYAAEMQRFVAWSVGFLFALCCVCFGYNLKKKKELGCQGVLFSVLMGMIVLSIVVKHGFNSYYLVERTALMYVPLFVLTLIFSLYQVQKMCISRTAPLLGGGLLLCLAALAGIHFGCSMNLSWTDSWRYDAKTKEVIMYLQGRIQGDESITLGANWIYLPALRYYQASRDLEWLQVRALDQPGMYDMRRPEIQIEYYHVPARLTPLTPAKAQKLLTDTDCAYYYLAIDLPSELVSAGGQFQKIKAYPTINSCLVKDL